FRRATMIVVVSPHLKRRITAQGVPEARVLVLPNAIDPDDFAQPANGARIREKLALNANVVIGFVGWFVEWHRLEMLIETFAEVCARHTNLRLVLIGEGELRQRLEALAKQLGVAAKVIFAGAVAPGEMPAHIAAMDICVVPHSNEYRSPIKLFEYMAQASAVVAPRT